MRYFLASAFVLAIFFTQGGMGDAEDLRAPAAQIAQVRHTDGPHAETPTQQIARGKYLVQIGSCTDCHTPGHLLGKPDVTRFLGGSDVGLAVGNLGVFVGPNLTPDKDTGLGAWTREQIVTAIRIGVRPDGRVLAPVMPWRNFAALTDADANSIADFLKSLPPVVHKVPGPFGPSEKVPVPQMAVLPPTAEAAQR